MSRSRGKFYARKGKASRKRGPSVDPDLPIAGCYAVKLVKDGPPVALRIWFGAPVDPLDGSEMDRAPQWFARVNNGVDRPASWFWPECAKSPIDRETHDHIVKLSRTMDAADPYFDPTKPVDPSKTPVPFR